MLLFACSNELTKDAIIIHRWAGGFKLDCAEIISAEILALNELKGVIRLFDSSGFHGYFD